MKLPSFLVPLVAVALGYVPAVSANLSANIIDVAEANGYTILEELLGRAYLVDDLKGTGPFSTWILEACGISSPSTKKILSLT